MNLTEELRIEHEHRCLEKEARSFLSSMAKPKYTFSVPIGTTLFMDGKAIGRTANEIIYGETPTPDLSFKSVVDRSCRCQLTLD